MLVNVSDVLGQPTKTIRVVNKFASRKNVVFSFNL